MTRATHMADVIGRPFLSCASTSYSYEGWPLVAAILLDAGHPGSMPASLPAMTALPGHPGVFAAPVAEGQALARRIKGAWLAVAQGHNLAQRLMLLDHLSAFVHLPSAG